MAISPTLLDIITITIDPELYYVPELYYIKYEISFAIFTVTIMGSFGGSVYGDLLVRKELDLPIDDQNYISKRIKFLQRDSYLKSTIILVIGILILGSIYIFPAEMGVIGEFRALHFIFLITSVPLIGYGYLSFTSRLDLRKACLFEGMVALIVPQILISIHILLYREYHLTMIVYFVILILGGLIFILSLLGYKAMRVIEIKRGLRYKLFLRISFIISGAISFLISGYTAFHPDLNIIP
jgi:hypothetical protein